MYDILIDKGFKIHVINIFKELKETIIKELKEGLVTVSHQIENIKVIERVNNQVKIQELRSRNAEMQKITGKIY